MAPLLKGRGGRQVLILVVASTLVISIPNFLVGGLATEIGDEIGFPPWALGLVVASFAVSAALASSLLTVPLSGLLSSKGVIVLAQLVTVLCLLAIAVATPSWQWLLVWALTGGLANGFAHPAYNDLLGMYIRSRRRATAFGIKQSGVPLGTLAVGLTIPFVSLALGWRWGFVAAAGACLLVTALVVVAAPKGERPLRGSVAAGRITDPALRRFLAYTSVATGIAAGAANALTAFLVLAGVGQGLALTQAGLLLTAAGVACAISRILMGLWMDRLGQRGSLCQVAAVMVIGGLGTGLMALPGSWSYWIGALVGMGIGWAWPGMSHYVVYRSAGAWTRQATGRVQTGTFTGITLGPIIAGLVMSYWGSQALWLLSTLAYFVAALFAVRAARVAPR